MDPDTEKWLKELKCEVSTASLTSCECAWVTKVFCYAAIALNSARFITQNEMASAVFDKVFKFFLTLIPFCSIMLQHYAKNFEDHGYVNKHFISSMKSQVCHSNLYHRRRNRWGGAIFCPRDFINIHTCNTDCRIAVYITFGPPKWNCFLCLCIWQVSI